MRRLLGSTVLLSMLLAGLAAAPAHARLDDSRTYENPPFAAGMRVYAFEDTTHANACTAGPMFRNQFGTVVMLVAGHCQGRHEIVLGGDDDGTTVAPTSEVGEFAKNLYRGPKTKRSPAIDVATVTLFKKSYGGRRVYTGSVTDPATAKIARTERPRQGRSYCISGSVSGTLCGFKAVKGEHTTKVEDGDAPDYWTGRVWRLKKDVKDSSPTGCTQSGDSGAPVYRIVRGKARVIGIHVAGECSRHPVFDDSAFSYVVPVYVAGDELNQNFTLP